ncbi:helix-turn-helix transcriptional regulator [Bdellovibrio sp. SKB1291214]|uniref:helix-turn-helix transcriptional regulator n=1 Tax=Bdellovibrio sp. SKB1291214 TaxID=1732569 RepID=UPI003A0FD526
MGACCLSGGHAMPSNNILRLSEVSDKVGLTRSSIYRFLKTGCFPKPINLSSRSVGWLESEVNLWIEQRVAARDCLKNDKGTDNE